MTTIEETETDEADSRDYVLHRIASKPSHGDVHLAPDETADILGEYASADEAHRAGRAYLRENPTAWLMVSGVGSEDTVELI